MTETAQPQSEIPVPVFSKNEQELEFDKQFQSIPIWPDASTWDEQDPLVQASNAPPRPQGTKLDFDRLGFDTVFTNPEDPKNKKKIRIQVSDEERVLRKRTWLDIFSHRLELAAHNKVVWDKEKSHKENLKKFDKLPKDQNTTFLAFNSKLRWNETKKKTPEDLEKSRKKRELKKKGEKVTVNSANSASSSTALAVAPATSGPLYEVRDPATGKSMLFEFRVYTQ